MISGKENKRSIFIIARITRLLYLWHLVSPIKNMSATARLCLWRPPSWSVWVQHWRINSVALCPQSFSLHSPEQASQHTHHPVPGDAKLSTVFGGSSISKPICKLCPKRDIVLVHKLWLHSRAKLCPWKAHFIWANHSHFLCPHRLQDEWSKVKGNTHLWMSHAAHALSPHLFS